jgi:hypothetical protein
MGGTTAIQRACARSIMDLDGSNGFLESREERMKINKSRNIARIGALLLLLAFHPNSFAAPGWTTVGRITELNQQPAAGTTGAGLVFVEVVVQSSPAGCSYGNWFFFATDDERKKRIFATLLAAHMSERNVIIYVTGNCQWGMTEMDGLIVR